MAVEVSVCLDKVQTELIRLAIFLAAQAPLLLAAVVVLADLTAEHQRALLTIIQAIRALQVGDMVAAVAAVEPALVFLLVL